MIKRFIGLFLVLMFLSGFHWWDPFARWIGLGNSAYENGDFEAAEESFSKAEKIVPGDPRAMHNLGASAYRREKLEDAEARFRAAANSDDNDVASRAWYDLGCTQLKTGNPEEALNAFKEALKTDPRDEDAKVNLEFARQMLNQMQTQTPQPQEQQQDGENQESDEEKQQTPQASPQPTTPTPQESSDSSHAQTPTPTQTPPDSRDESQPQSQDESVATPEPVQEGQMSPEEAERLLDALEEEELEVLKRFHQLPQPNERQIDKDW